MSKHSLCKSFILMALVLTMTVSCEKTEISESVAPTPTNNDVVEGWAILAEKDDYDDPDMPDMLVDYIDITRMRQTLERSRWDPNHIHDLHEFDRETLQTELDWLEMNADENDVVILNISAHGNYLSDVLFWQDFFADEWRQIPSHRRLLVIDACQAASFTSVVDGDPSPYLSIAAVAENEFSWRGLEEEGLPIIGGVFTYYFVDALNNPDADTNGDGLISVQEAALMADRRQRTYLHDVVFQIPEFVEMYHAVGVSPEKHPSYPHVIVDDTIGGPLYLTLDENP